MKLKKILAVLLSAAVFAGQAGPILAEGNKVEVLPMSDFYENLDDRNYIPLAKIG